VKGEGSNKKEARKKAASLMFTRLSNGGLEEVSFFCIPSPESTVLVISLAL
jgi:hypothetical protein